MSSMARLGGGVGVLVGDLAFADVSPRASMLSAPLSSHERRRANLSLQQGSQTHGHTSEVAAAELSSRQFYQ